MKKLIGILYLLTITACSANNSHITENVPDDKYFEQYFKRDLQAYFDPSGKKIVQVQYELLRKEPTQAGISYPKFYAWVRVFKDKHLEKEGAVRIEALNKIGFDVTNFISKKEIQQNPYKLQTIFPKALFEKIVLLANQLD